MPKSKYVLEEIKDILEVTTPGGSPGGHHHRNIDAHLKAAHTAALKALGGQIDVDPHPEGDLEMSVKGFSFDPYGTRCHWVQHWKGKECSVELFSMEYQPAQSVENNIRVYQPGQGIHLVISYGTAAFGKPGSFKQRGGSRVDSNFSKRYVHRDTYRGLDTIFYSILSKMVSAARLQGLRGISFPIDWDEIPYA